MNKILGSLLPFLFFASNALACRPSEIDYRTEFQNADSVAVAVITGIFSSELENALLDQAGSEDDIEVVFAPIPKTLRVVITQNIKGTIPKTIDLYVGPCFYVNNLATKVIVIRSQQQLRVLPLSDKANLML